MKPTNPFRTKDRRRQFDGMVSDFEQRKSVLFHADGSENQSNNIGNAFWRGYHGQLAAWIDPETPLYVAYAAGKQLGQPKAHRAARSEATPQKPVAEMGFWREPHSTWRNPPVATENGLEWLPPGKGGIPVWTAMLGEQAVAHVRLNQHYKAYSVRIEGWMWTDQPEGSMAQRIGVKESPVRGFPSLADAKRAVSEALAIMPSATQDSEASPGMG